MAAPSYDGAVPAELPPSYARESSATWEIPLPETEHLFSLRRKTGEQWLTLKVVSRASNAEDTPTFYQRGVVGGAVELDLEKEEALDLVEITLIGKLRYSSHSPSYFLSMHCTLWSADEATSTAPDTPDASVRKGKLCGKHSWPFSFRFPRGVSIVSHIDTEATRKNYRLPPSLDDGTSSTHIAYSLTVRVHRTRLRGGSKLSVPILFTPILRPTAPSITRQLAYRENVPLVGADGDPHGWRTLPPVMVRGTLFKTVPVEARCTLALARPLCYTRGTPMPLTLTIESNDDQTLDLLATNRVIQLKLVQRTSFGTFLPSVKGAISEAQQSPTEVRSRVIARAVWWPTEAGEHRTGRRTLAGELHIPEAVSPRCHILNFNLDHMVVLDPFQTVGFVATHKMALVEQSVEIATAFAEGPRPRPYMPPNYEERDVQERRPTGIRIAGVFIRV